MATKNLWRAGLLGLGLLGLSGCDDYYGRAPGYAYGGYGGYDRYYGNPYGWRSVPYGYAGAGYGWYNGYYYPGRGAWVYDRRGYRQALPPAHRDYWGNRYAWGGNRWQGNPGWRGNPGWQGNPGRQGDGGWRGGYGRPPRSVSGGIGRSLSRRPG